MAKTDAPRCCVFIASSPGCQGAYVAASSLVLALVLVGGILGGSEEDEIPHTDTPVSWDRYIIQDWGDGTCSSGTRVDDFPSCQKAFTNYTAKCDASSDIKEGGLQTESWDGPPGCHIKGSGYADFQFNTNVKGDRRENHAPVCKVGEPLQLKCYPEKEDNAGLIQGGFGGIILVLMIIPPIVMSVSRLCVPACCPGGMGDVPGCCPCNYFAQLDTTYLVTGGIMFAFSLLDFAVDGGEMSVLRRLRFVPALLILASAATAIVKLCIMLNCCCQECKPSVQGATGQPQGQYGGPTVIVGRPVTLADSSAKVVEMQ